MCMILNYVNQTKRVLIIVMAVIALIGWVKGGNTCSECC